MGADMLNEVSSIVLGYSDGILSWSVFRHQEDRKDPLLYKNDSYSLKFDLDKWQLERWLSLNVFVTFF